jgi:hypothetical protein
MDDSSVNPELVGGLLFALTCLLVVVAALLAWEGLKTTQTEDNDADTRKEKLKEVKKAVTEATDEIEGATSLGAFTTLNQSNLTQAEEKLNDAKTKLDQASTTLNTIPVGDVFDPLKGALAALTGRQAPARAFLAFALVTLVLSLVAFGTLDFSLATDSGGGTTTPTEPTDQNGPTPGGTSTGR